ncbi:MAG: glycosyltransferase, partial [Sediminibacterium sp.]|nr:glycosyltransferase [Sediminibacterium sp.]
MNTSSIEADTPNKIALVMATCNGAAFIEQQLNSILNQTRPPDLVIIRDDVSNDSTFQILGRYAAQYGFQISQNTERLGVNENFTRAVADVPDDYLIAFCDQDDYWLPEKLEKSIALLQQIAKQPTEPALVYSDLI